MRSGLKNTIHL